MSDEEFSEEQSLPSELTKAQRRVLGVLIEKGLTTPEYYPMTLKAVLSGCNQKSNRSPISNYSETQVLDVLEELRELGLTAVVHTQSGRTERYRHYVRKRIQISEPQLAILTELLLRGRQQMGELRSRSSRMVKIAGQDELRSELQGLIDFGLAQASGPLERRGIDVDHCLYRPNEATPWAEQGAQTSTASSSVADPGTAAAATRDSANTKSSELSELRATISQQQQLLTDLETQLHEVRDLCRNLSDEVHELKQQLGV